MLLITITIFHFSKIFLKGICCKGTKCHEKKWNSKYYVTSSFSFSHNIFYKESGVEHKTSILDNPFPHTTILQQTTLNIFCQKIENLYNWMDNLWRKVENIVSKGELLVWSNFLFCHYVFKKLSAAEAPESIYMRERRERDKWLFQSHLPVNNANLAAACK